MKLCIVIQSDAFRQSAGMRIRYDRSRECLSDPGVTIDSMTSGDLAASASLDHDVYIFCKTFDTSALLLARRIHLAGKVVGQDLFDDYFSQHDDPRLERFRDWLADMAPVTDYAVCSTPRMVEVLRPYLPGIRITSIDDPIIGFDSARIGSLAAAKAARARDTGTIEVVWFGIGDNPYFPVGLHDLVACEPDLAALEHHGWKVLLRIVTNRRAFEGGGAATLRNLSVDFEVVEWTEEVETQALERATLAILPVNGQSFSRAKSLNRAVTALNGGCQVLSIGYPLYDRLDDFIYRSVGELHSDLVSGRLRVRAETVDGLNRKLAEIANPVEAANLFVAEARMARAATSRGGRGKAPIICLVNGRNSTIALHKSVSALKGLSVGTPFNKSAWNFPVRFDIADQQVVMRTTLALAERFSLPLRDSRVIKIVDLEFVTVDTEALGTGSLPIHLRKGATPIEDLAVYEDIMRFVESACSTAFATSDILFSDTSPLRLRRRRLTFEESAAPRSQPPLTGDEARTGSEREERNSAPREKPVSQGPRWLRFTAGSGKRNDVRLVEESGLFDQGWYMAEYPDVASAGMSAARHYVEFGWREGRDPGPRFSTKAYLKAHSDVSARGMNPLLHYIAHGREEGRRISPSLRASAKASPIE